MAREISSLSLPVKNDTKYFFHDIVVPVSCQEYGMSLAEMAINTQVLRTRKMNGEMTAYTAVTGLILVHTFVDWVWAAGYR